MPKSLVVVGAGAVGVEFASIFRSFDSEVTILGGPDPVGPLAGSKDTLAHHIWDEALAVRSRR